jgi:hypothetical protein
LYASLIKEEANEDKIDSTQLESIKAKFGEKLLVFCERKQELI